MIAKKVLCITQMMLIYVVITGCSFNKEEQIVRIAINPWPGYEFLFLAQENGYFKQLNLNIELIEMSSLADVQRVYEQGRAHGMASTMIEAVRAAGITQKPLSVVLIPDYSNGGDLIIAKDGIRSISDLKGKKIGTEIGSLGMYILAQALTKYDMDLVDIEIINVEQLDAENAITNGEIDATVTYPPFSTAILKHKGYSEIFNTKELPRDIIDTISIDTEYLASLPSDWLTRFGKAWDMALAFSNSNKSKAHSIMARREGITEEEFSDALTGLQLLSYAESSNTLKSESIKSNIKKICRTLDYAKSIEFSCENILSLVKTY